MARCARVARRPSPSPKILVGNARRRRTLWCGGVLLWPLPAAAISTRSATSAVDLMANIPRMWHAHLPMKLASRVSALVLACLGWILVLAPSYSSAARPDRASRSIADIDLIVPRHTPVQLRQLNRRDFLAVFSGRFVISGRFTYGCFDDCAKPYRPADMRLYLSPDRRMVARLPRWNGFPPPETIEIENASAFAALAIPRPVRQALENGRQRQVSGRTSIVIDHFQTGVACDDSWASARFKLFAKPTVIDGAPSMSGAGCE